MNRLLALGLACLSGLAFIAPGTAVAADLALVIGNQNYQQAREARGARIDAAAVAEALERGGYEVISDTDLNRNDMRRAIARFGDRVGAADRVVVFYSGHALRSGGVSYLAPVDQRTTSLVEVMMDGVPLDLLLRLAGQAQGRSAVFVDGSQLEGFEQRGHVAPGLAEIAVPDGVVVVSAAAPGRAISRRTERQSAFASQVIDRFLKPGMRLRDAASGVGGTTWVGGNANSSLVLVPSGRGQTSASAAAQTEARLDLSARDRYRLQQGLTRLGHDTRGADGVFGPGTRSAIRSWQRANDLDVTGHLTAAQVAQLDRQISEADTARGNPAMVEAQLRLNTSARRDIQQNLNRLGHDTRGTDGNFGSGTRSAIRSWQERNNFPATGYLTSAQVAQLDRQVREANAPTDGRSAAEIEAGLGLNAAERREVQEGLTRLGYDTRGTDGNFGSGTRTAIRNWQRANDLGETGYLTSAQVAQLDRQVREANVATDGRSAAEIEAGLRLNAAERREVQEGLTRLGYDTRGTDGNFGSGTRTAIRNWQRSNDHDETGYLTARQVAQLDRQVGEAETASAAATEASLELTREDRLSIEQRLAHLGFVPGAQDGVFDDSTRQAIASYQRNRDRRATGYLDRDTISGIVQETQGSQTGLVDGAKILQDLMRGLGNDR